MKNQSALLLCTVLAVGCTGASETITSTARGSIKPLELVGSCQDACGGPTLEGNCWCDDLCTDYGDCCEDLAQVCEQTEPTKSCGGFAGLSCGEGEYCHFAPEDICGAADALGVCKEIPVICTKEFAPVCGCDGKTYGNACGANAAGTSVVHKGECKPEALGCHGDWDCGEKQFCNFAQDQACGADDQIGTCSDMPEVCILLFAPVCGCDGNTYGNSCQAAGAGVSVEHEGECEAPKEEFCGGFAGFKCSGENTYCHFEPEDTCGFADKMGVCRVIPQKCTKEFMPVCGCDGKTYGNACSAEAAGTSVFAKGPCKN